MTGLVNTHRPDAIGYKGFFVFFYSFTLATVPTVTVLHEPLFQLLHMVTLALGEPQLLLTELPLIMTGHALTRQSRPQATG